MKYGRVPIICFILVMNNSIYSERYMKVLAIANSNFEHPSTVESWYCSTREHEKLFCLTFSTIENDGQTNEVNFYCAGLI
jgi:hypothetical protein